MSSNPHNYNIDNHLAKRRPHLGNVWAGYLELYKARQRYTPCPHEYIMLVATETTSQAMGPDAEEVAIGHREAADTVDKAPTDQLLNTSGMTEDSERGGCERAEPKIYEPAPKVEQEPDTVDHKNEAVQPENSLNVNMYEDLENPMAVDFELDQPGGQM
ncbi:hypothetical protein C8Q73DRAFT_665597 [Cubamyces lactineus]|nr:hypothetical protein C8Q73DRAFT_665597 [Cubamyces lactineus]